MKNLLAYISRLQIQISSCYLFSVYLISLYAMSLFVFKYLIILRRFMIFTDLSSVTFTRWLKFTNFRFSIGKLHGLTAISTQFFGVALDVSRPH
jgi:hypothetical protein